MRDKRKKRKEKRELRSCRLRFIRAIENANFEERQGRCEPSDSADETDSSGQMKVRKEVKLNRIIGSSSFRPSSLTGTRHDDFDVRPDTHS